jgi:hypothetical protein
MFLILGPHPLLPAARVVPPMDSRERILVAIHGGKPDRVPRALGFYHLDFESLAPLGPLGMPRATDDVQLCQAGGDRP